MTIGNSCGRVIRYPQRGRNPEAENYCSVETARRPLAQPHVESSKCKAFMERTLTLRDGWREPQWEPMKTNQHSSLASLKLNSTVWSSSPQVLCMKVLFPKVVGRRGGKCWGDGAYENLKTMELYLREGLGDPGHFPLSFSSLPDSSSESFSHSAMCLCHEIQSHHRPKATKPSWLWLGISKIIKPK